MDRNEMQRAKNSSSLSPLNNWTHIWTRSARQSWRAPLTRLPPDSAPPSARMTSSNVSATSGLWPRSANDRGGSKSLRTEPGRNPCGQSFGRSQIGKTGSWTATCAAPSPGGPRQARTGDRRTADYMGARDPLQVLHHDPAVCPCGQVLPPPKVTGRPRVTCSTACRRAQDYRRRKVRRLDVAIAMWRAEDGQGGYPRARIRSELAQLRADRADLVGRGR